MHGAAPTLRTHNDTSTNARHYTRASIGACTSIKETRPRRPPSSPQRQTSIRQSDAHGRHATQHRCGSDAPTTSKPRKRKSTRKKQKQKKKRRKRTAQTPPSPPPNAAALDLVEVLGQPLVLRAVAVVARLRAARNRRGQNASERGEESFFPAAHAALQRRRKHAPPTKQGPPARGPRAR